MKPCDEGSVGLLPAKDFCQVIEHAPLVSIDLIVVYQGKVLLGKRTNRPAQGYWFVPGGRVRKNETLDDAFARLSMNELSIQCSRWQADFLGIYEHFYKDSMFSDNVNTHYIVVTYILRLNTVSSVFNDNQHSVFRWWGLNEIIESNQVHYNTKLYAHDLIRL